MSRSVWWWWWWMRETERERAREREREREGDAEDKMTAFDPKRKKERTKEEVMESLLTFPKVCDFAGCEVETSLCRD